MMTNQVTKQYTDGENRWNILYFGQKLGVVVCGAQVVEEPPGQRQATDQITSNVLQYDKSGTRTIFI